MDPLSPQIGVSQFLLYNNGHLSVDPAFGSGNAADRIWHKKPEADYHLDLTDGEVDRRIDDILQEFELKQILRWQVDPGDPAEYDKR